MPVFLGMLVPVRLAESLWIFPVIILWILDFNRSMGSGHAGREDWDLHPQGLNWFF
jgi:hypothetical protein